MPLGLDWGRMATNPGFGTDEPQKYYSDDDPHWTSIGTETRWGLWAIEFKEDPDGRRRAIRTFTGRTFTRRAGADRAAPRQPSEAIESSPARGRRSIGRCGLCSPRLQRC